MKSWIFGVVAGISLGTSSVLAADLPVKAVAPVMQTFEQRWYVEGRLGVPLPVTYDITSGGASGVYEPSYGWNVAFAVGTQFAPNWRADIGFAFTRGGEGEVRAGGAVIPHDGAVNVYSIMLNGYYVFTNFGPRFQPFIGAGIGAAVYDVKRLGAVGSPVVVDDTDTTLALALHLGVDVPLTRQVSLTTRYTLGHTGNMSYDSSPPGITSTRDAAFDHILSAGLRLYLN